MVYGLDSLTSLGVKDGHGGSCDQNIPGSSNLPGMLPTSHLKLLTKQKLHDLVRSCRVNASHKNNPGEHINIGYPQILTPAAFCSMKFAKVSLK
jgi:hypothetical protein